MEEQANLSRHIHGIVEVFICNNHYFKGELVAYDKHMNLALHNVTESIITEKGIESREMELIVLRGEQVRNVNVIQPPPPIAKTERSKYIQYGIGQVIPYSRSYN